MDAGLKGGILKTFQWLVGPVRQSRGRVLPWQPQAGLRAKSLVQGHMAGKLCWAWTRDSAGQRGSQGLGDWKGERGMACSPRSGPMGRVGWQVPGSPLAGVWETCGARSQAFLLDESGFQSSCSLALGKSHNFDKLIFPSVKWG